MRSDLCKSDLMIFLLFLGFFILNHFTCFCSSLIAIMRKSSKGSKASVKAEQPPGGFHHTVLYSCIDKQNVVVIIYHDCYGQRRVLTQSPPQK